MATSSSPSFIATTEGPERASVCLRPTVNAIGRSDASGAASDCAMSSLAWQGLNGKSSEGGDEMGAVHVHEFMSLDGVIDAPTWTFDYGFDPKMGAAIGAVTERSRAILLGRTTYEMFEPAWSTRTVEDDPGAPFFNDTIKYVVSGTLTAATWRNSEILGPYDPERLRRLKDEVDGDLYVSGSGRLVRAMLADGLID